MPPRISTLELMSESTSAVPRVQPLPCDGPHVSHRTPAHLSARPRLVRPEMTMGSKGSSVPEMVMPRGPP